MYRESHVVGIVFVVMAFFSSHKYSDHDETGWFLVLGVALGIAGAYLLFQPGMSPQQARRERIVASRDFRAGGRKGFNPYRYAGKGGMGSWSNPRHRVYTEEFDRLREADWELDPPQRRGKQSQ